jgi:hypothetical protein
MYNVINPSIFPKTEADAEALVTSAAYSPFISNWYSGLYTSWGPGGIHVYTEMTTDIGACQWNDSYWPDLRNVNFTANSYAPTFTYANYMNKVSQMTQTMGRVSAIDLSESSKNSLLAQLHCGRGWLTYILYNLYGGLQLASPEILNNPQNDEPLPRKSAAETVDSIKADLTEAIQYLPDRLQVSDSNYGRFTKALAYTVLMKLYMHEKDWNNAIACGRELMSSKYGFKLMAHYKDIFTLENEGNDETIWAAVCSRSVNKQLWLAHVLPSQYPTKNPNIQKWNGYRVPWAFYHTFDPADERLQVLVGDFVGTDGVHYNESNPGSILTGGAMPIKYGEDPAATGEESQIDWIVFRYADVLTLMSEALARQNNAITDESLNLLNMVHTRAGLKAYTKSDFSSVDAFLDAILLERGHELWFEDCRRTDLIRYGKYIEYARTYRKSTTAQDYMTLMPLPQSVIDEGKGKVIQNPGY